MTVCWSSFTAAKQVRNHLQLWQFILELLVSANSHLIQWTNDDYEFQINKPDDLAQLWGTFTGNPSMNFDKLLRGLRYYHTRGLLSKVSGKRLTFKYSGNMKSYIQMRQAQVDGGMEEVVVVEWIFFSLSLSLSLIVYAASYVLHISDTTATYVYTSQHTCQRSSSCRLSSLNNSHSCFLCWQFVHHV